MSSITEPGSEASTASSTAPTDGTTAGTTSSSTTDVSTSTGDTATTSEETTGVTPPMGFCESIRVTPHACEDFDSGGVGWTLETSAYEAAPTPHGGGPNQAVRLTSQGSMNGDLAPFLARYDVNEVDSATPIELAFDIRLPPPPVHDSACGQREFYRAAEILYFDANSAAVNILFELGPQTIRAFLFTPDGAEVGLFNTTIPGALDQWHTIRAVLLPGETRELTLQVDDARPMSISVPRTFVPPRDLVSVNIGPWHTAVDQLASGCFYDFDNLVLFAEGP